VKDHVRIWMKNIVGLEARDLRLPILYDI